MATPPRTHRVHAEARPDGCDLELSGLVRQTVLDTIQLLAEHPALMDDLDAILGGHPSPDPYHPERDLPTEELVERLTGLLPTAVRLHHRPMAALADSLTQIVTNQRPTAPITALPQQQDRRWSA